MFPTNRLRLVPLVLLAPLHASAWAQGTATSFSPSPADYMPALVPDMAAKTFAPNDAAAPVDEHAPIGPGAKVIDADDDAPAFPAALMPPEMLNGFRQVAATAFNLWDVSVQELPLLERNGETLTRLRLPEGERIVRLHPYSMREPGARLQVEIEGGLLIDTPWPQATTYRGTIDGAPDYEVAASILDGKVSLLIMSTVEGNPSWHLQPMSDALPGMPAGLHVLYRDVDVISRNKRCGVGMQGVAEPPPPPAPAQPPAVALFAGPALAVRPANPPAPHKPRIADDLTREQRPADEGGIAGDEGSIAVANVRCQIALDADYEYYQACGSSVLAVIYEMERVMNHVGLIYQNQVGISYTETFIIIRSAINDPYNTGLTGSGMRDEFRNHWVANHAGVTRDVAHLFSNRASSDGFIGFAYFAGICNNNNSANSGHCWSSTFWSADLANKVGTVAHELGHVWNATHCDGAGGCGIMNSSINGSWSFGTPSANLIIAHRDSRPCLDAWFNPVYVNNTWGGTENGSISNPWNTIFEGLDACLVGGTLNVQAGNYLQNPNIFKAKTINAQGGTVRIGN